MKAKGRVADDCRRGFQKTGELRPLKLAGVEHPSRSSDSWTRLVLILLAVIVLLCIWHRYLTNYYYTSTEDNSQLPRINFHLGSVSSDTSLVDLLGNLTFKNGGIVRSSDQFVWHELPCLYLEAQNVSGPYVGWAVEGKYNYLYQNVSGNLSHPPSGMRSSVVLGGISTGNFELRADGSFHEWTLFNQHPAGAAKMQLIDDMFMGVRAAVENSSHPPAVGVVLQTHPRDQSLPAAQALQYHGAHPISKLDVLDDRLPMNVSVYAYPWYKFNDMNRSATPAVAFTAVMTNPLKDNITASFMINLPQAVEYHSQRVAQEMPASVTTISKPNQSGNDDQVPPWFSCINDCAENNCSSWSYDNTTESCATYTDIRLNGFQDESYSGVMSGLFLSDDCLTVDVGYFPSSAAGNMSLCPFSSDKEMSYSFGEGAYVSDLWDYFLKFGNFEKPYSYSYINGAAEGTVTLGPGETKEVTIVLGWYFPYRDFLGLPVGNYYNHLVKDSVDAANQLGQDLPSAVAAIANLHRPFFNSSLPTTLQDMLINSLSHVRSAFWLSDGRWRQWEAYDCVNIDSVHNDGERHIPYITIFPNSTINKMYAWAEFQLSNGMIQEQLRCGCQSLPLTPKKVEFGCGRVMSDVSSMYIVYLLELLTWYQDNSTQLVVQDLWPNAKRAAQWQLSVSAADGIPGGLVDTYDVLGLNQYPHDTYSGAFHLLAMRAAETLAYYMGDADFAMQCHTAYLRGQEALDNLLWNETGKHYNAYQPPTESLTAFPNTPGAIMTDSFYAQVLAYSLGLGTLVQNETRLILHMNAELDHNDTPYGMLVLTGRYPYPGPSSDNAVWMMGNPNWGTINIHLGEDVDKAVQVGLKAMTHWRSVIQDQWNVVGIMGGLGYGADGLPFATSHYGFFMSSWHMVMALSGQNANMTALSLTFEPKLDLPYSLPVILPGVWGSLQADTITAAGGEETFYSVGLSFGSLRLTYLAVDDCKFPNSPGQDIVINPFVSWNCTT